MTRCPRTLDLSYSLGGLDLVVRVAAADRDDLVEIHDVWLDGPGTRPRPDLIADLEDPEHLERLTLVAFERLAEREDTQREDAAERRAEAARDHGDDERRYSHAD